MSEIAEIRKLFQDLIAPDLKSVATEIAAGKVGVEHQFKAQKELIDQQLSSAEDLAKARYLTIMAKMETLETRFVSLEAKLTSAETMQAVRHDAILRALDIDRRLERIEARQTVTAATPAA